MRRIDVVREAVREPAAVATETFRVTVVEDGTSSKHSVTIASPPPEVAARFPSLEAFVTASFAFLLEREPRESILSSFEIREIGRYFPEWEKVMGA